MFGLPKAGRLLSETARKLGLPSSSPFATWRVPLHAPDFPLVLLYSEKAGCTTLTKWFLFQIGKLEDANRYHKWVHRYRTSVLIEQPGYRAEAVRLVHSGRKPVVKLVRNPYDRAVSSFFVLLNHAARENSGRWERAFISAARRQAGKPESSLPTLSFRDFMRTLSGTGIALGEINSHIARQHVPEEHGRISRVIKLERFAEDIRSLEAEFGLAESPLDTIAESGHHRASFQDGSVANGGCAADLEITSSEVRSRRLPVYQSFYDQETRDLVRRCFAIDFEAYGYDP